MTTTYADTGCGGAITGSVETEYVCLDAGSSVFNRYQVEGTSSKAIKVYTFGSLADCDAGIPHTLAGAAATYTEQTCELNFQEMSIALVLENQTTWKMALQQYEDCGNAASAAAIFYAPTICVQTGTTYTRYQPDSDTEVKCVLPSR